MWLLKAISKILSAMDKRPEFELRGCDALGCGHFLAPRGSREHLGLDVKTEPGEPFPSPVKGRVIRLGWAYAKDPRYRIVDIEVKEEELFRAFYVDPTVTVGQEIELGETLGVCQDIAKKHGKAMTNHAHCEYIIQGRHVDPRLYLKIKGDG